MVADLGAALIGGGIGSAISTAGDLWSTRYNAQHQESMLRRSQAWQERMSNTAYQRGVKDLRAAGLNPILSYMSGQASTPSASGVGGVSSSLGSSAVSAFTKSQELANLVNQNKKLEAETKLADVTASRTMYDAKRSKAEAALTEAAIPAAKNKENLEKGIFGKVMPYIERGAAAIGNIFSGFKSGASALESFRKSNYYRY